MFYGNTQDEDCDYAWGSFPKGTIELTLEREVGVKLKIKSNKGILS